MYSIQVSLISFGDLFSKVSLWNLTIFTQIERYLILRQDISPSWKTIKSWNCPNIKWMPAGVKSSHVSPKCWLDKTRRTDTDIKIGGTKKSDNYPSTEQTLSAMRRYSGTSYLLPGAGNNVFFVLTNILTTRSTQVSSWLMISSFLYSYLQVNLDHASLRFHFLTSFILQAFFKRYCTQLNGRSDKKFCLYFVNESSSKNIGLNDRT